MNAHRNGTPMLASSGYVCQVDEVLCIGCEECQDFCQFEAINVRDGYAQIDYAECMGCGVCLEHCLQDALSLVKDEKKGIPLVIEELLTHEHKS